MRAKPGSSRDIVRTMLPVDRSSPAGTRGDAIMSPAALPAAYRLYSPVHHLLTALGTVQVRSKHPSIILRNRINRMLYRSVFTHRRDHTIQTRDGFLIRVPLYDQAAASIVFERAYSPGEAAILRQLLKGCALFVDVGANLGYFSLLACALNRHQDDFAVVTIEPNAALCRLIKISFELNQFDCAELIEAAAGREAGCGYFQVQDNLSSNGRAVLEAGSASDGAVRVEFVRIDDLVQYSTVTGSILIKIDVEGGEVDALAGATEAMRHGAVFMCEVWASSVSELDPFLASHNYVMMDVSGNCIDYRASLPSRTDVILAPASRVAAVQHAIQPAVA